MHRHGFSHQHREFVPPCSQAAKVWKPCPARCQRTATRANSNEFTANVWRGQTMKWLNYLWHHFESFFPAWTLVIFEKQWAHWTDNLQILEFGPKITDSQHIFWDCLNILAFFPWISHCFVSSKSPAGWWSSFRSPTRLRVCWPPERRERRPLSRAGSWTAAGAKAQGWMRGEAQISNTTSMYIYIYYVNMYIYTHIYTHNIYIYILYIYILYIYIYCK